MLRCLFGILAPLLMANRQINPLAAVAANPATVKSVTSYSAPHCGHLIAMLQPRRIPCHALTSIISVTVSNRCFVSRA